MAEWLYSGLCRPEGSYSGYGYTELKQSYLIVHERAAIGGNFVPQYDLDVGGTFRCSGGASTGGGLGITGTYSGAMGMVIGYDSTTTMGTISCVDDSENSGDIEFKGGTLIYRPYRTYHANLRRVWDGSESGPNCGWLGDTIYDTNGDIKARWKYYGECDGTDTGTAELNNAVLRVYGYTSFAGQGPFFDRELGSLSIDPNLYKVSTIGGGLWYLKLDPTYGTFWVGVFRDATRHCSIISGSVVSASGFQCSSDKRAKQNVADMPSGWATEKINALRPVCFKWIDPRCNAGPTCGFLAQEAEEAGIPGLVYNTTSMLHDGDYKALKYESAMNGSVRLVPDNCVHTLENGTIRPGDSVELVLGTRDMRTFTVNAYSEKDGTLELKCSQSESEDLKTADGINLLGHTVDDYRQMDNDALLAVVTRAVQELSKELADVKAELQALKASKHGME